MADRVGQQFGTYRLLALLGEGSYAGVYLGQHVRLPLQAAIKVLHTHLLSSEVERFQHEAETIARLAHPAIVRILDYDVQDGVPFLVMDYAPGGSLRQRYPKGSRVPLPLLIAYVKQAAAALQYAHDHKVIHRDIKPENLLLGRDDEVLLSDFGLVALAHTPTSLSTQGTAGTLAYMAPEQIEGHPRTASDQYALGVVVYEWLCGERPFEGSITEVMVQHLSMPPAPLRERVPTLSAQLEQVVLQALAKDPTERFARVQDFALALEEAYRTEASSAQTLLELSSASLTENRHAPKYNVPARLTSLIGREREVEATCTLLRRPEIRLLTLTGTGGVGKTRLALQVATELLADFPDGVCFVSLAPISDPTLVIPTIAHTFELKETAARPALDLLKASLGDKHLLLLLDNFEQVLAAAPPLTDLLASCPHLTILVTSRATLHVGGEHEFPVPPLILPDLNQLPPTETLSGYAAVALFVLRAQAAKPTFHLTATNAHAVAEICVQLDGLPLAIELAAARSKLLPPQALLTRLEQRLTLLTSGGQDAPVRQQTLRNTLAWSYDLLSPQDQRLFRQLSVFVGGCTLEAVEAICAALDGETGRVFEEVASLLDQSLLQQTESEGEEPRLMMLETIHEYGLEALAASGEMEATQRAHALYYLALAEEAEPELHGPQQAAWLERLAREHDNLRAAMRWSLEPEAAWQSREIALRLGGTLVRFWYIRGHYSEGRNFLERALAGSEGVAASLRANALIAAAIMALIQGDYEQGEALCEESLALFRELGDKRGMAHTLYYLGGGGQDWGGIARTRGNLAVARSLTEEGLAVDRELGDKRGIAWDLLSLAGLLSQQGEYTRARDLLEESLEMHRELGNAMGISGSLQWLTWVLFLSQGDSATVHSLIEKCLVLFRELGDKEAIAFSFYVSGQVALSQGDAAAARSLAEESVVLYKELGYRQGMTWSLSALASVVAVQGDHVAARALYEESLAVARKIGDKWAIASSLKGLAGVVATQGEPAWAAQLWGAAEALREVMGAPIPPVYRADYERAVAAARAQLGEKAFAAAWAQGRSMTPEQALATQTPKVESISRGASSAPSAKLPTTYPDGLSARELEVLRLLATGLTDAQIAEQLVLSLHTIHAHLRTIYSKLGVTSRSAATRYAFEHQLV
jgi:predicted ATPase/DNA-binding CsgD family transcriptional regulator